VGGVKFLKAAGGLIFNLVGMGVASPPELSKGWGISAYGVHLSFVHRQKLVDVAGFIY